jgi:hypothetical protein
MMTTMTWADAAWEVLGSIDERSEVGHFSPETFAGMFENIGDCVREHYDTRLLTHIWGVGCEASRGLRALGLWDPEEMLDILVRKQNDYGHENINAFGIVGLAVRISDKIARYRNLDGRDNQVANESYLDTLKDMVGYAVIAQMYANKTFQLPLVWEF